MQIQNYQPPIETGRWNNIDSVNRICTKCDKITIGDEYHYTMECQTLEIGSPLKINKKGCVFLLSDLCKCHSFHHLFVRNAFRYP